MSLDQSALESKLLMKQQEILLGNDAALKVDPTDQHLDAIEGRQLIGRFYGQLNALLQQTADAAPVQATIDALKDKGLDGQLDGTICQEVADHLEGLGQSDEGGHLKAVIASLRTRIPEAAVVARDVRRDDECPD